MAATSPKANPFRNCAREPRSPDLAALLTAMGAKSKAPAPHHPHPGRSQLHGARHRITRPHRSRNLPHRRSHTGGDLNVDCCEPKHLGALISKLEQCGVKIDVGEDKSASAPWRAKPPT